MLAFIVYVQLKHRFILCYDYVQGFLKPKSTDYIVLPYRNRYIQWLHLCPSNNCYIYKTRNACVVASSTTCKRWRQMYTCFRNRNYVHNMLGTTFTGTSLKRTAPFTEMFRSIPYTIYICKDNAHNNEHMPPGAPFQHKYSPAMQLLLCPVLYNVCMYICSVLKFITYKP